MSRIEFIELVKKHNQDKEKNIKILIVAVLCFFALGFASNHEHIRYFLYMFGALCFGRLLSCRGNPDEVHMLKVAVELLSLREKTNK